MQVAEHAGYQRSIISRNPPLLDEEGYEIDSDDDDERVQEAVASAMEENPYSTIHLERECMLLAVHIIHPRMLIASRQRFLAP